jgi:hypothetical protein
LLFAGVPANNALSMNPSSNVFRFTLVCFSIACLTRSSPAQELYQMAPDHSPRWSSFENPSAARSAGGQENHSAKGHAFDGLKAGQSVRLLDVQGSGVIRRIWITLNDRSPEMLRSLTLAMYWDGATRPAVLTPLGDFFSISHGKLTTFESAFFSNPEGRSLNCNLSMPFRHGARILLRNDSKQDLPLLFYDIDFEAVKKLPPDALYFHAYWSRQPKTRLGEDFEILPHVNGRGRFLGVNVGVIANPELAGTWWGEGEVKMYLDGDTKHPTLVGTGTEDYVGSGWGLGKFAQRFQGCPIADKEQQRWSFYRFHVPDPVFFKHDARVTIQVMGGTELEKMREVLQRGVPCTPVTVDDHGHLKKLLESGAPKITDPNFPNGWVNFYRQDDYCATAYFYLDKPTHDLPPLPPLEVRTVNLK